MPLTSRRIPVCEPSLNGNEVAYVTEAVKSTWISSSGKYLKAFEEGFARYVGVNHGIGTVNGTSALHLAIQAAGIRPGDEVILPDFTMIAPALAICYAGAMPVFVDADPDTWTLDHKRVEPLLTAKTKAVIAVHIYGHPVDMNPLKELAERHNLVLIEDAAEAHGAEYRGKKCGSLSDISAFSFYANKIITTGEGGMVLCNDDSLAQKSRYYRNLCFSLEGRRSFLHEDIGFNYRMNNVQAAIGLAQLEKIEEYVELRRAHAQLYNSLLKNCSLLHLPIERTWAKNCYWMYGVVLNSSASISRFDLMTKLSEAGIETRPFFQPMHRQPALRKYGASCDGSYLVSDHLADQGFYLPSSTNLTTEDIHYVCEQLIKWLK